MLVSSSPTPIFTHLFGPDVEPGYRPIHLPKLHIVTVDEPPGGFDGGLIINTIQLNHADRQGFAISLPVGNWIVFYSFIVDTRSRLHMNVRFAPDAVAPIRTRLTPNGPRSLPCTGKTTGLQH